MNARHDVTRTAPVLVALTLLFAAPLPLGSKASAPLTLLFTSDEYGYVEPCG